MISRERVSLTASSGSVSQTLRDLRGRVGLIFCKAATATTTFDLTITDDQSDVMFTREGNVGELNEIGGFLLKGICTLDITNSSVAAETFTFKVMVEELA